MIVGSELRTLRGSLLALSNRGWVWSHGDNKDRRNIQRVLDRAGRFERIVAIDGERIRIVDNRRPEVEGEIRRSLFGVRVEWPNPAEHNGLALFWGHVLKG